MDMEEERQLEFINFNCGSDLCREFGATKPDIASTEEKVNLRIIAEKKASGFLYMYTKNGPTSSSTAMPTLLFNNTVSCCNRLITKISKELSRQ